jgi:hypothetical protein
MWQKIKRDHGLVDLHFHDLRHEAVSRFVEAGFSDQEVSAISATSRCGCSNATLICGQRIWLKSSIFFRAEKAVEVAGKTKGR